MPQGSNPNKVGQNPAPANTAGENAGIPVITDIYLDGDGPSDQGTVDNPSDLGDSPVADFASDQSKLNGDDVLDGSVERINALTDKLKKKLGETALVATRAELSEEQIKNVASGLASDAMEDYKTTAELTKEQKRGRQVVNGAIKALGITAGFLVGGIIGAGAVLLKNPLLAAREKQSALRKYRDFAMKAIKETGNLSAGQAAIEKLNESRQKEVDRLKEFKHFAGLRKFFDKEIKQIRKEREGIIGNLKEEYQAGQGSEQYILERAKEAFKDKSAEELYTENGEKFERDVKDDDSTTLKSYIEDYARSYIKSDNQEEQKAALDKFKEDVDKFSRTHRAAA